MADWCHIYMEFDPPLPEDLREKVYADLRAEDYDFPKDALVFQDWVSYRSPIGDLGKVLGGLGLSGRYWLFGNLFGNEPQDKDRNDENIVEFGPAVANPYARQEAYRAQILEVSRKNSVTQVVTALRALQAWFATAEPRDFKTAARILRQGAYASDDRFQELCAQEWDNG